MSDKVFFDTNVLVYAIAEGDRRAAVASALLSGGGVISAQVMNEFVSVARKKLGMGWEELAAWTTSIRVLCPAPMAITVDTHDAALRLAGRYGFSFYDALIAASAKEAKCSLLYSEDFQDGQVIEGSLTVRNPFRA